MVLGSRAVHRKNRQVSRAGGSGSASEIDPHRIRDLPVTLRPVVVEKPNTGMGHTSVPLSGIRQLTDTGRKCFYRNQHRRRCLL